MALKVHSVRRKKISASVDSIILLITYIKKQKRKSNPCVKQELELTTSPSVEQPIATEVFKRLEPVES